MAAATKSLPHNDEAEQSVLGAILIDSEAIISVSEILKPEHFYNFENSVIYEAMLSLYDVRKPIDLLTIKSQLKKRKDEVKIDSVYLTELVNVVPTAANVSTYSQLVKESFLKRSLIKTGNTLSEMGYSEGINVEEMLDKAESSLFAISQRNITNGFVHVKETLAESFDRIDEIHRRGEGLRGVGTGFSDVDNILSGLQPANLVILAARPGQGKTALVLNIAQNIAINEKKPVGIFSLEMSKEELVDRLLVSQADVDAWKYKTGRLADTDYMHLSDAMGKLGDAPIFIDDTPGLSINEMRSKARRLQLEHNVSLIIVDYLQLVDPGRRYDNRVQEVSVVSQSLKNLARELNVPVLSASQLSRAVEHRGEKRPQLADLRESGAIEQDADVVMFLYRPEDAGLSANHVFQTKLLIAKHRNGPTGEIDLLFRGDRIRFYNTEKTHIQKD